jgi:hypothetical protein
MEPPRSSVRVNLWLILTTIVLIMSVIDKFRLFSPMVMQIKIYHMILIEPP